MNKEMMIFNNVDFGNVRVMVMNEEVWFVAKDVADILGFRDGYTATRCLDEDEKLIHTLCVAGQNREITMINESGLYSLIMSSKKPEAKKFKRWVTAEVLPEIRKTGGYIPTTEDDSEDDILAKALMIAQKKIELKNKELAHKEAVIQAQQPKVELYDDLISSEGCVDFGQLAKVLQIKDGKKIIGRNKLIDILKKEHILDKHNVSYQRYIEGGYFVLKSVSRNGMMFIKTLVTTKGIDYLYKNFKGLLA